MFTLNYSFQKKFLYLENIENLKNLKNLEKIYALEENDYNNSLFLTDINIKNIEKDALDVISTGYDIVMLKNTSLTSFKIKFESKIKNLNLMNNGLKTFRSLMNVCYLNLDDNNLKTLDDLNFPSLINFSIKNNPLKDFSNINLPSIEKLHISTTEKNLKIKNVISKSFDLDKKLLLEGSNIKINYLDSFFQNFYIKCDIVNFKNSDYFLKNTNNLTIEFKHTLTANDILDRLISHFDNINYINFINGKFINLDFLENYRSYELISFEKCFLSSLIIDIKTNAETEFKFNNLKANSTVAFENVFEESILIKLKNMNFIENKINIFFDRITKVNVSLILDNVQYSIFHPCITYIELKNTDMFMSDSLLFLLQNNYMNDIDEMNDINDINVQILKIKSGNYLFSEEMQKSIKLYSFPSLSLAFENILNLRLNEIKFTLLDSINFNFHNVSLEKVNIENVKFIRFSSNDNIMITDCLMRISSFEIDECKNLQINNSKFECEKIFKLRKVINYQFDNIYISTEEFYLLNCKMLDFRRFLRLQTGYSCFYDIIDLDILTIFEDVYSVKCLIIKRCPFFRTIKTSLNEKYKLKSFKLTSCNPSSDFLLFLDEDNLEELDINITKPNFDIDFSKFNRLLKLTYKNSSYETFKNLTFKSTNLETFNNY